MNKSISLALVAGSLLLIDVAPASAHDDARDKRWRSDGHYSRDYNRHYDSHRGKRWDKHDYRYQRSKHMPKWLKKDRSFKRWFNHTHWRADRRISWDRLFQIYLFEHRRYGYRWH